MIVNKAASRSALQQQLGKYETPSNPSGTNEEVLICRLRRATTMTTLTTTVGDLHHRPSVAKIRRSEDVHRVIEAEPFVPISGKFTSSIESLLLADGNRASGWRRRRSSWSHRRRYMTS